MKIKLSNLNEGLNKINYECDDRSLGFADSSDKNDITFVNPVFINGYINKVTNQYFVEFQIDTKVLLVCDRCLEEFEKQLNDNMRLIFSLETELYQEEEPGSEFRLLPAETTEIDITDDIRESLLLMIPMKILCDEECSGLCSQCGLNLNYDKCQCEKDQIDPRWEALRKLKES
jgi:uncharacterized protein